MFARLSRRVTNGRDSVLRVFPRSTASGKRATVFADRRVSVSRRSCGLTSTESSSAPGETARRYPSNSRRSSCGVRLRNEWRKTVSLTPPKSNDVVRSSAPSASSEPSEAIFSVFFSAEGTGDVRSVSPSGRATRYERFERYEGRRSRVDSSVGSMRRYFLLPSSTATIAWLKNGQGTEASIFAPAWISTG